MTNQTQLHLIAFTRIWPGVILVNGFIHLVPLSSWWLIPTGVGFALLLIGVWRTHRIVMPEFGRAETKPAEDNSTPNTQLLTPNPEPPCPTTTSPPVPTASRTGSPCR